MLEVLMGLDSLPSKLTCCPHFYFGFWFWDHRVGFHALVGMHRHFVNLAGVGEVLDESCRNDVGNELELELEDNPGTTRTTFSVLHRIIFP